MKFNINKISYNDVMAALNSYDITSGDLKEISEVDEILNKFLDCNMSDVLSLRYKMLAIYKLGIMQGEREERAKLKNINDPRQLLLIESYAKSLKRVGGIN